MRPHFILTLLISLLYMFGSHAQDSAPLTGPLIAITDSAQQSILIYELHTQRFRELRMGEGIHNVWSFSPDGCTLLYTLTDARGLSRAYTASLDGANVRELVQYDGLPADQWGVWSPTWSPAGDRIAFTLLRDNFEGEEERQYHIAHVPPQGGMPTFYSVTGREHGPQWSPDGAWLAYISYDERAAGENYLSTAVPTPEGTEPSELVMLNEADLWVVSADASAKHRLTAFVVGSADQPRWSPDGQRIGFIYSPSGANNTFWYIDNHPAAKPVQLNHKTHLTLDLTWHPSGETLIASARGFREIPEARLWQIPLVPDADQTATVYLDDALNLLYPDFPRFSPDGRYLAYRSAYALVVFDLNTREYVIELRDRTGNTPPYWSPTAFENERMCASQVD